MRIVNGNTVNKGSPLARGFTSPKVHLSLCGIGGGKCGASGKGWDELLILTLTPALRTID